MVDVHTIESIDDHDYGSALVYGQDIETREWGWQWIDTADMTDAGLTIRRNTWRGRRKAKAA